MQESDPIPGHRTRTHTVHHRTLHPLLSPGQRPAGNAHRGGGYRVHERHGDAGRGYGHMQPGADRIVCGGVQPSPVL